ncbi:MAG: cation:proton antiporter [Sphingomonas sp.]|uniref:cation:proton antiporter domain-containing protein n=1 Tax=unclassified Sphingomonas TaxID=196159 RepID=UPI0024588238|nr:MULTISPECIES: cation:proton antiporter [unclassified Sphingomonas]MBQ1499184.1 cation:proton antiporter [Sphingomonas sp.]MDH4746061.1 cation:proton antiporter [Sphingomonas sp. CBMAI 2297]
MLNLGNSGLSDTLVILGAAGLVIPAFARVRISPVIGFILVGALVGPFGLGSLVPTNPWLYHITISDAHAIEPFAEFGIILLLFSIGLELSFKRLWSMRTLVFGVGATELLGAGLILAAVLYLTGLSTGGAIGLGLALALSSTAIVLPIAGTTSAVGRAAFAMLLFEDLALVPIIFLLGALAPAAGGEAGWIKLAVTLGFGLATVAILFVGGRMLLPRMFAQAARTKSPELFLAASLLVVIVASLATSAAGLSPIVGALIAGLLIAETEYHGEVEAITAPFKGLALGVFLITVGMRLDLDFIVHNWAPLLGASLLVMLVKAAVTTGLLRLSGARAGTAAEAGVLMASPSETTLIVLGVAGAAGLISPSTAAFWTTVTAIGLTATPLLAKAGSAVAQLIERSKMEEASDPALEEVQNGTVIIGFGRVGRTVADMLRRHNLPYIGVDADIDNVNAARRGGYNVLFGDVTRSELVDKLNLGHAKALVLTMDDPVLTVRLAKRVRGWVPNLPIIARARDSGHAAELYRAGASEAVPEALESSLQLSEVVLVDLGLAVGPVIASIHEKRDEMRKKIKEVAGMDREPRFRRVRVDKGGGEEADAPA